MLLTLKEHYITRNLDYSVLFQIPPYWKMTLSYLFYICYLVSLSVTYFTVTVHSWQLIFT